MLADHDDRATGSMESSRGLQEKEMINLNAFSRCRLLRRLRSMEFGRGTGVEEGETREFGGMGERQKRVQSGK